MPLPACMPAPESGSESLSSPNIYPARSLNLRKKGLVESSALPPSSISSSCNCISREGEFAIRVTPSLPPPLPPLSLPEFAHQRVRYCCLRCLFIGVSLPILPSSPSPLPPFLLSPPLQSATLLSRFASLGPSSIKLRRGKQV